MAATPSNMIPLGTSAPDFTLPDTVSGEQKTLQDLKGEKGLALMFICNHCPYVKHLNSSIAEAARDLQPQGIAFAAISSNDVENYPALSP